MSRLLATSVPIQPGASDDAARVSRRGLLAGGAGAGALLALAACSGSAGDAGKSGSITAAEWGGVWDTGLRAVSPGFTKKTGVAVTNSVNNGDVVTMLQQNKGQYDLAWVIGTTGVKAYNQKLTEAIDRSRIPALSTVNPALIKSMTVNGSLVAVPISYGATGILYRTDLVPFAIKSWKDLWDPRLKGKVTIQNAPSIGGLFVMMAAGLAYGSGITDYDAGFNALKRLEPNIQSLYKNSAEPINSLASGKAAVAVTFVNYGASLQSQKVKIVQPDGGSPWSLQAISIPKATRNKDAAYKFINYMLEKHTQVEWADKAEIATSRTDVTLPAKTRKKVLETADVADHLWDIDWVEFADNLDTWTERWQKIFTS